MDGRLVAVVIALAEFLLAEHLCDRLVLGGDAGLRVDGEEDEVCVGDGFSDLVLDIARE